MVAIIVALGMIFWLAGGADWLEQKTRKMKIDNDWKEHEMRKGKNKED